MVPVDSLMQSNYVCFESHTELQQIWEFFRRMALRRVVIVDGQRPIGTISRASLLRWASIYCRHSGATAAGVDHGSIVLCVDGLARAVNSEMKTLQESLEGNPPDSEMALICAASRSPRAGGATARSNSVREFRPRETSRW